MAGTIDCDRASSAGTCVSMESGLDGRNNKAMFKNGSFRDSLSQWSPA